MIDKLFQAQTAPPVVSWGLAAITAVMALFAWSSQAQEPVELIGAEACIECHEIENLQFKHTLHDKIFRLNPRTELQRESCESCHGAGSRHRDDPSVEGSIIAFGHDSGTPITAQNEKCLTCHDSGPGLHWGGSVHQTNQVGCADCHTMAKLSPTGLMAQATISDTCFNCHPQQRAEFRRRSHMPLHEGKISCADCHAPHGSTTPTLIKADSINELCFSCHAEKRGPFLWEHAPVRDNCMNCHLPHGSNQDKLLQLARPVICQQCHGNLQHPGTLYNASQSIAGGGALNSRVLGRSCQNCHSQIHGSNHPAGARFQR